MNKRDEISKMFFRLSADRDRPCVIKLDESELMMARKKLEVIQADVESRIFTVRGQKVILDQDLAVLYDVETGALNRAVKRNMHRFPEDFCFRLTADEYRSLRCQNGTSKKQTQKTISMRCQNGTASKRNIRYLPNAFTEHGAIMAANVLRSRKAEEMSVFVVRAFVKMRQALLTQHELKQHLGQIEKILLVHHHDIEDIYRKIRPLLLPPEPPKKEIRGFRVKEKRAPYRVAGSGTGRATYSARKTKKTHGKN